MLVTHVVVVVIVQHRFRLVSINGELLLDDLPDTLPEDSSFILTKKLEKVRLEKDGYFGEYRVSFVFSCFRANNQYYPLN